MVMTETTLSGTQPSRRTDAARDRTFVMVTDLARELGITARALRFYEDKGLITPHRVGATRIYTARERARMILVLRGKRLGFSLREIKDYLDLYDADPRQVTQTRALLERIAERRAELVDKQTAIAEALAGLDDLERDASAILAKAQAVARKAAAKI
ncbi:MerR family transcriptional regulator [Beijerinckiaceae bacterium RH AL1]|nr:MerR family transcriptional regulator [Beijerinckiaceae bacterium RH AL8]VVB43165.1 MerR family transcriptional regulator [Beijerinckiaceae bacterium RH CH11]VVC53695.1 MerR family transcriptional regulator [Beijerinckiaceae bacterium RH AL1]